MNVNSPGSVSHLSHEDQQAPVDLWKAGLPSALYKHLIGSFLSFPDIVRSAGVCRTWRERAQDNSVGRRLLEQAGLRAAEPGSWMEIYSEWFRTKVFIALDVSGSMLLRPIGAENEPKRMEIAMEKFTEIARHYEPVMQDKGITVTLFAKTNRSKTVRSMEELLNFVENRALLGPTRSEVVKALNGIVRRHRDLSAKTALPSTVIVISDMGFTLPLKQLKLKAQKGLNFKLIKVGKSRSGSRLFEQLDSEYKAHLEAQRLREEKSRNARRSARIIAKPVSEREVKRERTNDIEITFESITEKKAKIEPHAMG